jgi:hypothetical protein
MARRDESTLNFKVGLAVIVSGVVGTIGIIVIGQGANLWKDRVDFTADFRQVSGLRTGSLVQIEGMEIGTVEGRDLVTIAYPCHPDTEDRGRFGAGRTDDCDPTLFCAAEGKCAELEAYSFNKELHSPCEDSSQCGEGEVCVTDDFRRRYRRVLWTGPAGVCDGFTTDHNRIRVTLSVFADSLDLIRSDSRAVIAQNGVLGDQLVQISIGRGEPIQPGGRIQSTPSMGETIDDTKERVEGGFAKVEGAIGGIAELASEMGNVETVRNVQNGLASTNERLHDIASGKGTFGALLNDEAVMKDFSSTLRGARATAHEVDGMVASAERGLVKFDDSLQPLVDGGRKSMADISSALRGVKDPNNKSWFAKLVHDPNGRLVEDVESTLAGVRRLTDGVQRGDGTLGRLLTDPKVYDDTVKFFQGFQNDKVIQFLVRWSLKSKPSRRRE